MICEHFIYALRSEGYKLLKTNGVNKLIGDQNLKQLIHCGDNLALNQDAWLVHYWPEEKLLSYSHIKRAQDKYGRNGLSNHTFLVPIRELISPLESFLLDHVDYADSFENSLVPIQLDVKAVNNVIVNLE